MTTKTTLEPVTFDGWYEHADGTVGKYCWHNGTVRLVNEVSSWAEVRDTDTLVDEHRTWTRDDSDPHRTIWQREDCPIMVESYEWEEDFETVRGWTVSYSSDGMAYGGEYTRFRELDEAIAYANRVASHARLGR